MGAVDEVVDEWVSPAPGVLAKLAELDARFAAIDECLAAAVAPTGSLSTAAAI